MRMKTIKNRMRLSIIRDNRIALTKLYHLMKGIPDHTTVPQGPNNSKWASAVKKIFAEVDVA